MSCRLKFEPNDSWCWCVCACAHVCVCVYMCVCACMCLHVCVCMHACACVYMCVYACVCMCVCVCVWRFNLIKCMRACLRATWSRLIQYYLYGIVRVCICVSVFNLIKIYTVLIQYYLDGCVSAGKSRLVWTRCQTGVLHHTHGHLVYVGHRWGEFHCYSQWSISLESAAYRL